MSKENIPDTVSGIYEERTESGNNKDSADKTGTNGKIKSFFKSKRGKVSAAAAVFVFLLICSAAGIYFFAPASLALTGDGEVYVTVFEEYTDGGAEAAFLGRDLSDKMTCSSDVNTDVLGEYSVCYALDFRGKHYEVRRKVSVIDGKAPEIILTGECSMILSDMKFYQEPGFSASDNYDGDLTDKVETQVTETEEMCTVLYRVTDSSGNSAECLREIEIRDIVPPVLTIAGGSDITITTPTFADPGYSASDDLDGDITASVTVSSDYAERIEGDFTFEYSVSDKAGNTARAVRTVHVSDTLAPAVSLNGNEKIILTEGDAYADAGASAYDDFDGDLTCALITSGTVNTSAPGTYTVSYSVSDKKGNTGTASRTVTVYAKPVPVEGGVCGGGIVSDSTVYLTFDDGPSSRITPEILDILKANNVKATFFIVNYSDENMPIISRMIAEGHTIGIHGYSHDYGEIYSSVDAFINNVTKLQKRLSDDFGYNTNIIRFPGGSSNMVSRKYCPGIMSRLAPLMEAQGYTYFDWNVSSGDASGGTVSSDAIINNVTCGLKHGRANVVLMHDTNAKSTTAAALQSIISYGVANGYTFAAVSSNTPPVHHSINN